MAYRQRFDKKRSLIEFLESNEYYKTHWTMRELAVNLGYAPSTKFNELIWELVDSGDVCVQFSEHIKYSAVDKKAFVCLPDNYSEQLTFVEMK